jgi:positive regulator of sigma E activity
MNAFFGIGIVAAILYGVLFDGTFWKIYGILLVGYLVFVTLRTDKRDNHKRRILTIASWDRKL